MDYVKLTNHVFLACIHFTQLIFCVRNDYSENNSRLQFYAQYLSADRHVSKLNFPPTINIEAYYASQCNSLLSFADPQYGPQISSSSCLH